MFFVLVEDEIPVLPFRGRGEMSDTGFVETYGPGFRKGENILSWFKGLKDRSKVPGGTVIWHLTPIRVCDWKRMRSRFPEIVLDAFVGIGNHIPDFPSACYQFPRPLLIDQSGCRKVADGVAFGEGVLAEHAVHEMEAMHLGGHQVDAVEP